MKRLTLVSFCVVTTIVAGLIFSACAKPAPAPSPTPSVTAPKPAPSTAPATSAAPKPAPSTAPATSAAPKPAASPTPASSKWPAILNIASKEMPAQTYLVAVPITKMINKYIPSVNSRVATYPGVMNWPDLMQEEKVDLGMFTIHSLYDAAVGQEYYQGKPPATFLRMVSYGETTNIGIIARRGAGIKTPADLKGKRWMAIRTGSDLGERVVRAYLDAYGMKDGDITIQKHSSNDEFIAAIKEGRTDAVMFPMGAATGWTMELARSNLIELVSDTPQGIARIAQTSPYWYGNTLPAGTYENQKSDWNTIGFSQVIGIRGTLPEDLVYEMMKAIWDHFDEFVSYHAPVVNYKLPGSMVPEKMALPFHSGVVKYLKEKGYWTAAHEAKQNALLATLKKAQDDFAKKK